MGDGEHPIMTNKAGKIHGIGKLERTMVMSRNSVAEFLGLLEERKNGATLEYLDEDGDWFELDVDLSPFIVSCLPPLRLKEGKNIQL